MPLKHDNKKTRLCISSTMLFLKDGLQYNHWVGTSVMKPGVDMEFYKN